MSDKISKSELKITKKKLRQKWFPRVRIASTATVSVQLGEFLSNWGVKFNLKIH